MTKILIGDDHPIVRHGLKQIIAEESDMQVLGEAADAQEVLAQVAREDWDVVILDLQMPGRGGLQVLETLRREHPKLPVLVLSVQPEDQYAVRVLKCGAAGYMTKETAPEELVKAIRKVVGGGKYVSLRLAEKLASDLESGNGGLPHETLSNREFQVLCMIGSGKTVGQIADELCLSVKTISTNRERILEKMGMQNNAELTHYAIKNRLVE
jgi:two-component system, NarL family, invasion response regulator UvrY